MCMWLSSIISLETGSQNSIWCRVWFYVRGRKKKKREWGREKKNHRLLERSFIDHRKGLNLKNDWYWNALWCLLTFANQYLFDKRAGLTLTTLRQVKFSLFLFLWLTFAVQIILITRACLYTVVSICQALAL